MTDLIDVPIIGERILYTWGEDVANRLNSFIVLELAADETINTNPGTAISTITGMEFPVENGKTYRFTGSLYYECDTTSQGPAVGFRHPGGSVLSTVRLFGITGGTTETIERVQTSLANTNALTTSATVSTADSEFQIDFKGRYKCTADGTFFFRKSLNGTPSGFGLRLFKGSGAEVYISA